MEDSRHGQIEAATIVASELEETERFWLERLAYRVRDRGTIDAALASSWGAPAQSGRPYVLLEPESGTEVFVRLVEGAVPPDVAPRRTLGWAALELTVRDADAVFESLQRSGVTIIGEPEELEFTDKIYPMQIESPSGEVLYLNEVRGNLPDIDLPRAVSFVDHIFIVILAAADLDEALAFYRDRLGFEQGQAYEIPYKVINDAFGFDPQQRHRLVATRVGRRVNVEIDEYPEGTSKRPAAAGMLPPAAAMISFAVESLDDIGVLWLGAPAVRDEAPYHGRRVATCRGVAGELIELIEIDDPPSSLLP